MSIEASMANSNGRKLRVFISCSEQDEKNVSVLNEYLKESSVETWWYKDDLIPGQDRDLETKIKIHEADIVFICLSDKYWLGGHLAKEVNIALDEANSKPEREIYVIPVNMTEGYDLPAQLKRFQSVNWFGKKQYNFLKKSLIAKAHDIQIKKNEKIIEPMSLPKDFSEEKYSTGTPREYVVNKKQLSRSVWLRRHGLSDNPFSLSSFKGEFDPKLIDSFVIPPGLESSLLYGSLEAPGYTFLVSPSGGGKSSLCRVLTNYYSQTFFSPSILLDGIPVRVLPVNFRINQIDLRNLDTFVDHIIWQSLESAKQRKIIINKYSFSQSDPPLRKLEKFLSQLQKQDINGICVLFDNLGVAKLEALLSIVNWGELVKIRGLILKIFLPVEIMNKHAKSVNSKNLLVGEITWYERDYDLLSLLKRRLRACTLIDDQVRDENYFESFYELKGLFDNRVNAKIPDEFVNYALGCKVPAPRQMWNLGYALLSEHFRVGSGRREDQIINGKVFASVINMLPSS